MKFLFILLCANLSVQALAADEVLVKSLSVQQLWGADKVNPEFKVNSELGRAWVEITIPVSDGVPDVLRVNVDGLSYDQPTETINLDYQGKITTCATSKVVGRSIFQRRVIKMTPACKFVGRWKIVNYDDGFEIKKTRRHEVFLIVKD